MKVSELKRLMVEEWYQDALVYVQNDNGNIVPVTGTDITFMRDGAESVAV